GRLNTLTTPTGVMEYAYSPTTGNLISMAGTDGTSLSYGYDGSLLTSTAWSGGISGSVTRSYDNNFRIISQSINGGSTIAFGYDNDSLLISAGALTIARHPEHGLITGTTLGTVADSRS